MDKCLLKNYQFLKVLGRAASKDDLVKWKQITSYTYVILGPIHLKAGEKILSLDKSGYIYWTTSDESELEQRAKDWKSEFKSSYNRLYLPTLAILNLDVIRPEFVFFSWLVEQVRPHITTVELEQVETELGPVRITVPMARRLAEFFNQFPNLKYFEIHYICTDSYPDEFDTFFQTLRSNIEVYVTLYPSASPLNDHGRAFTMLQNWTQKQLYNITVWKLVQLRINTQARLDLFVTLCMNPDWAAQIHEVTLDITLSEEQGLFPNKEDVVACLTQLSPKLKKLKLYDGINWNVLNEVTTLEHLNYLYIYGQTGPLDFLNNCPQLKVLKIHLNEKTSIFHDYSRSYHDALRGYFSNLTNLEELTFWNGEEEWVFEIDSDNELENFLKGLLPAGIVIEYEYLGPTEFVDLDV